MHISVITLFPEMFSAVLNSSILKRAQKKGKIDFTMVNLRDFGLGAHKSVDDTPYGGGAGMVLRVDVVHSAIKSIKKNHPKTKVILLEPTGTPFTQNVAEDLARDTDLTFICGHYEGTDARIKNFIDMELSLGDFVLTGGEIPAMAVIDAVSRLIPGVLGKEASFQNESFSLTDGKRILEHNQYTRPQEYESISVPEPLLSGNHKQIEEYRKKEAVSKTRKVRPELV